jgi:hypothetical protein
MAFKFGSRLPDDIEPEILWICLTGVDFAAPQIV